MSKGGYFAHAGLAVVSTMVLVACSSDTPTSPATASQSLTEAAPTIAIQIPLAFSYGSHTLCYPLWYYHFGRFSCYPSTSLSIINTGGGTLNWTSTKSGTWLRRSPKYGTAPKDGTAEPASIMKVWLDSTAPSGTYYGWVKIWAAGATNSPQKVYVKMIRH
jgi:hypothetical protein